MPEPEKRASNAALPTDLAALLRQLPAEWTQVIDGAREVSRATGAPLFLVGGPVRDLLLGRRLRDLDLVIEGDSIAFGRRLAALLGGSLARVHAEFLTATVELPDGSSVDLAATRSEIYPRTASLPQVAAASLREDLGRRDFAVNTLTVRLAPEPLRWIDPLDGWSDLLRRRLRVLHERSFFDDPTRVLRAARLEARLGFRMEPQTERLAREAVSGGAFESLSGSRLRDELFRLLAEEAGAPRAISRLAEFGWIEALDGELSWGRSEEETMERALRFWQQRRAAGRETWTQDTSRLLLAAMLAGAAPPVAERLAERLALAGRDRRLALGRRRREARAAAAGELPPHELVAAFEGLEPEDLALLAAQGAQAAVIRFLDELAGFRLSITGNDLLAAGVPAGPDLGAALERTRAARLDGEIAQSDELRYALELVGAGR